jgi:hypothetical protein
MRAWDHDYSPVIHFARSIRAGSWEKVRIALFTAYVDESGTHDASRFIGVGGVIADADQWAKFEQGWRKALADADIPYSHMKEFAFNSGPFKKWASPTKEFEPQRRVFMKSLCDCIVNIGAYTFGAVITREHYNTLVPDDMRDYMGTPYAFLGRYCIARVGVWAQQNSPDEPVNLIFERGQPQSTLRFQHRIISANEEARKQYRIGLLTFGDKYVRDHPKDSVLPLQAADIVAYELVKQWQAMEAAAKQLVKPYWPQDSRRYPLKRLMELPRDWNELRALDIARDVHIWRTIRDYANAIRTSLLSDQ